ncbi:hypothetical protein ACGTJS_11100 [Faucicola mancuniensis]|uniref:hypothetical protein n=1 Tax=Faucicola mancuniensis TaxID=1309795 RepID=UPI003977A441
MNPDIKQAQEFDHKIATQVQKTERFLADFNQKRQNQTALQAFDSLLKQHPMGEAVAKHEMPDALATLLNSRAITTADNVIKTQFDNLNDKSPDEVQKLANIKGTQAIFDGIEQGIAIYKKRNGGAEPSANVIYDALITAVNTCTEHSTDQKIKAQFDSLSFEHHEALSVVPAQIMVTILTNIANSLPMVAKLPNPIGSNEVPLIYGRTVANMRMGATEKGDYIDGVKAGHPYLENRHTLIMEKAGADFSTPIHVGYTKQVNADHTIGFVADTTTPKAPFLGGRVVITVKGVPVANDHYKSHPTQTGVSKLQPIGDKAITVDGKEYLVTTGSADLDNHTVSVTFDTSKTEPEQNEVHVQVIFDYERKKPNSKEYVLTPPGMDMEFNMASVYASPMRTESTATIDAITQMRNELNLDWRVAVLAATQQKYYLEQNARLLREQVMSCLQQANHTVVFDAQKAGVQYTNFGDGFTAIKASINNAKVALSEMVNFPIAGVDIFVGKKGAGVFMSMTTTEYTPTGVSYGDNTSIYQIGTMTDGTRIYYVPDSLAWLDETGATTTATALLLPRPTTPTRSPFVGTTAVAPMTLTANYDAFAEHTAIYSRMGADRNPHPDFGNQAMLIQMLNLPSI